MSGGGGVRLLECDANINRKSVSVNARQTKVTSSTPVFEQVELLSHCNGKNTWVTMECLSRRVLARASYRI